MKFLQIFNKVPNYKRFGYTPRHYDPKEEERKEREARIKRELTSEEERQKLNEKLNEDEFGYRQRISGSFKTAKKTVSPQSDPSSTMLRLIILVIITVGLIAFLEYGRIALVGVALVFIPFYLYLKFRKFRR